jgi:hypothetical protein
MTEPPPIFDEPPLNEGERCLLVIMEKLMCEEMAEFSKGAIAAAANVFAIGAFLCGGRSPEEAAQWLGQQAKRVRSGELVPPSLRDGI